LAAFFAPYVLVNRGHSRGYWDAMYLIPTPAGWLTPPPGVAWSEAARSVLPAVQYECWLFPGVGVAGWVLATAGWAWAARKAPDRPAAWPLVAACLVSAAAWSVLCLRLYQASPWAVIQAVPGAGAIRCVSRVVLLVDLFALLAAAVWLTHALGRVPNPRVRATVFAALAAVVAAEQVGHEPKQLRRTDYYAEVDQFAARLRGAEVGYVLPRPGVDLEFEEVFAMWAGLRANVPVVNGYSGRIPDGYPLVEPADPDAAVRAWLAGRFHGRVTVVDRADPASRREIRID
jgi:hypothetical protein